jgi:hypothetical protein
MILIINLYIYKYDRCKEEKRVAPLILYRPFISEETEVLSDSITSAPFGILVAFVVILLVKLVCVIKEVIGGFAIFHHGNTRPIRFVVYFVARLRATAF